MAAAALLSACGVSSSDGVMARSANKGGFMGLAERSAVEVSGAKAVQGVNDVVIGSFKVGFVESGKKSNTASGGFRSTGIARATGKMRLEGVSDSLKQQITDTAYRDFVAQLKNSGFNIVNRSNLTSSASYGKAKKYSFPYESDQSGLMSSYGKTAFYQPSNFGNQGITFMGEVQGASGGFAFGSADNAAVEFVKKEGGVPVVSATYVVDFATTGGHGGYFSQSTSVQVGQNLAVTSGTMKVIKDYTGTFQSGTASFGLGQPVESSKEFATIENETSTSTAVVEETVNVATALLGGGMKRSKNFVVKADPSKYKAYAIDVLKDANAALVGQADTSRSSAVAAK